MLKWRQSFATLFRNGWTEIWPEFLHPKNKHVLISTIGYTKVNDLLLAESAFASSSD